MFRRCRAIPKPASAWRAYSCTAIRRTTTDIQELRNASRADFIQSKSSSLRTLQWKRPLQNVLLVRKENSNSASAAVLEFLSHVSSDYPSVKFAAEPSLARDLQSSTDIPIYTTTGSESPEDFSQYHAKSELIVTFGGDGTILHASSLFAKSTFVPPILSFSLGTLGFLNEYRFQDFKSAFREVFMSGAPLNTSSSAINQPALSDSAGHQDTNDWQALRGKNLGSRQSARVLLRQRLKLSISGPEEDVDSALHCSPQHAMNEVLLHRGSNPHLTQISVLVNDTLLTESLADGISISTPTGSTAYSLSAGGSIVHPLVPAILLTPICPRSLSFRPVVLPAGVVIKLRIGQDNRSESIELSIDGERTGGLKKGLEIRVAAENITSDDGHCLGGVPCLLKGGQDGHDGWVGGLNGLLKFNYPFGDEVI